MADRRGVEKNADLEDGWGSHIHESRFGLPTIQLQFELKEMTAMHRRNGNHAITEQNRKQLLDTIIFRAVSASYPRSRSTSRTAACRANKEPNHRCSENREEPLAACVSMLCAPLRQGVLQHHRSGMFALTAENPAYRTLCLKNVLGTLCFDRC